MKLGWPVNVNQIIIDSTTLDLGEGTVEQEMQNGKTETWLKSSCIPETINVTMDFDFFEKDENGLTEFDRFTRWFKFKHKYGTVPFEFPTIYKTGREITSYSTYKIKGSPKFTKRGLAQRASMVWTEDFKEFVNIPNKKLELERIFAENGSVYLFFNNSPDEIVTTDKFSINFKQNDSEIDVPITSIKTDNNVVTYTFPPFSTVGTYSVTVEGQTVYFEVV